MNCIYELCEDMCPFRAHTTMKVCIDIVGATAYGILVYSVCEYHALSFKGFGDNGQSQ